MRRLVNTLDSRHAQHRQTPGVLCQFVTAEDRLWIGAAYYDRILADSLFVRQPAEKMPVTFVRSRQDAGGSVSLGRQWSPSGPGEVGVRLLVAAEGVLGWWAGCGDAV